MKKYIHCLDLEDVMLFKQACIKCRRNTDEKFNLERFNELWREGFVVCPADYFDPMMVDQSDPPEECGFALEHFLVKNTPQT